MSLLILLITMGIKVKIILTLNVDDEEYRLPSDGNLSAEIEDFLTDMIHEVGGLKISSMKIVTQET